ncbi:NUDIX domain-containing protein [Candidatus Pacearchaeota archaeon]|nr:NUDIX domain-containing protein [Candidatus Pacearchaeota archaeon]
MKKEKSAGAIIYYTENGIIYFLLVKSTYWGFVKGWIEENESITETIKREAKEEANLDGLEFIKGFEYKQHWTYRMNNQLISKDAVFYLAKISKEEAKNVKISFEHVEFKWASFDEAMKLLRIKDNQKMLAKAYEFVKEHEKQKRL